MSKTYSVTWRHRGRVYSTQWSTLLNATPAALPGPTTLRPLGLSYVRYAASRVPGIVSPARRPDGGVAYRVRLVPLTALEFGAPRLGIEPTHRWVTLPIVGGLAAGRPGEGDEPHVSVAGDPCGPAGLLRIAARLQDRQLWTGVELEAYLPGFAPDSPPFRYLQLPIHSLVGHGFLRWWHRHLGAFAEPVNPRR